MGAARAMTLLFAAALFSAAAACAHRHQLSRVEYEATAGGEVETVASGVAEVRRVAAGVRAGTATLDDVVFAARDLQEHADEAAEELRAVRPPDGAARHHAELAAALGALARELDDFVGALERRDATAVRAFERGIDAFPSLRRVDLACARLRAAGFHVPFESESAGA